MCNKIVGVKRWKVCVQMSLKAFREPSGGPRLLLADVWCGGCSCLEHLEELLMRSHCQLIRAWDMVLVPQSQWKQKFGSSSASGSCICFILLPSDHVSALCSLVARVGALHLEVHVGGWLVGRPECIGTTLTSRGIQGSTSTIYLWAVATNLYSHCFGISAGGNEARDFCCPLLLQLPTCCLCTVGPGPSQLPKPSCQVCHVLSSRLLSGCIWTLIPHWSTNMIG